MTKDPNDPSDPQATFNGFNLGYFSQDLLKGSTPQGFSKLGLQTYEYSYEVDGITRLREF